MKIKFMGAARTVTGSCYLMEHDGRKFCVDCGMHQGNAEIEKRNQSHEFNPKEIDFFIVTHAHIDHSGLLPYMVKNGFKGPIYVTPPTKDLLEIMLLDSAHIQEMEAEWKSRRMNRHGNGVGITPFYTQEDALETNKLLTPVGYGEEILPANGLTARFLDAGHILGSAMVELDCKIDGGRSKLLLSGDIGRPNQLMVNDPTIVEEADYLFLESTYGDRDHKNEEMSRDELAQAIKYSYDNGEKVVIPAFAVERTQEIIYTLHQLDKEGKLPKDMPIYLDSPLAIKATNVFKKYMEYMDEGTQKLIQNGENPLDLPSLKFTQRTEESKAINNTPGAAIVISASGMANAGRIKHHLRHNLWKPGASVVFVGYQAMGTPGRKIVDGAKNIRIFNEDIAVKARIFTIGGFSAHSGQSQTLNWLGNFKTKDMKIVLIHGELKAQQTLAKLIKEKFGYSVLIPDYLDEMKIIPGEVITESADPQKRCPAIDMDYVLGVASGSLDELKKRLDKCEEMDWVDQSDVRDRIMDINKSIVELISEL